MDDEAIIDLYWDRDEKAIRETHNKFGRYCHSIAYNILQNRQDAEECVNDTWLRVWDAIPPQRPGRFLAFVGKITRNLALNRLEAYGAQKRGSGQNELIFDELAEVLPAPGHEARIVEEIVLTKVLNGFLAKLTPETRIIFMRRYWYLSTVREIARDLGVGESKVKMTLLRTRNALKQELEEEGIVL